jgi:DNA processing protein
MMPQNLSPDAQAILLLCSSLGLPLRMDREAQPLSLDEWNDLARRIADSDLNRPGALLECSPHSLRRILGLSNKLAERLRRLLDRGGQLAIELERLASLGIWVLTRVDDLYPKRLKQKLSSKAPSVLYGAGDQGLLAHEGLAVVGSRNVDEAGAKFAEELGRRCAKARLTVISGAAKGVDRQSMTGALEAGGTAVGVLADSLERAVMTRETRRRVMDGQLTLVTPYHPRARFTVGTAMQRNKIIYGLARYALVVASASANGGTWAGAVENLKAGWVPLFVRVGSGVPVGNIELLLRGALEFPDEILASEIDLQRWFEEHALEAVQGAPIGSHVTEEQKLVTPAVSAGEATSFTSRVTGSTANFVAVASPCDLFPIVWPYIANSLSEPRTERDIAGHFSLEAKQVKAWLTRALKEGLVRKLTRPIRYELAIPQQTTTKVQSSLFDPTGSSG